MEICLGKMKKTKGTQYLLLTRKRFPASLAEPGEEEREEVA
jgi:hypothetical protein